MEFSTLYCLPLLKNRIADIEWQRGLSYYTFYLFVSSFFNLNSNNILYLSWFIDNLVQFILPVAVCIKSLSIYIYIYLFCYIFAFLCVLIKLLSFIYRMHWHETIFLLLQSILVLGNIFCYKWFKTCFGFETKKIVLILVCWTVKTTRWLSKYLWYSRNKG